MSLWRRSHIGPDLLARCGSASLIVVAAILIIGCGDTHAERDAPPVEDSSRPTTCPAPTSIGDPGTSSPPDSSPGGEQPPVHPTDLSIAPVDGGSAAIAAAVCLIGGEVIEEDPIIGTRARFPVRDVAELVRIRDRLRAQGFTASLVALRSLPQDPNAPS
jgi:hypothetical protein